MFFGLLIYNKLFLVFYNVKFIFFYKYTPFVNAPLYPVPRGCIYRGLTVVLNDAYFIIMNFKNLFICKFIYRSLNDQNDQNSVCNATCKLFQLNCAGHNYPTRISFTNYLYKKSNKAFLSSYVNKCCSI